MEIKHFLKNEAVSIELFESILPIAQKAFGRFDDDFKADVFNHLSSSQNTLVVVENNQIIAFWFWDYFDFRFYDTIIYLSGVVVLPELQEKDVGSKMIEYVLQDDLKRTIHSKDQICPLPKAKYIAIWTQNPNMARLFYNFAKNKSGLVMSFDQPIDKDGIEAIRILIENIKSPMPDCDLISRGFYGKNLYGKEISQSWEELGISIKPENGDALYCLWRRWFSLKPLILIMRGFLLR